MVSVYIDSSAAATPGSTILFKDLFHIDFEVETDGETLHYMGSLLQKFGAGMLGSVLGEACTGDFGVLVPKSFGVWRRQRCSGARRASRWWPCLCNGGKGYVPSLLQNDIR
jgi:hypothetical protein